MYLNYLEEKAEYKITSIMRSIMADYLILMKPRISLLVCFTALLGIIVSTPNNFEIGKIFFILLSVYLGSGSVACFNMYYERFSDKAMKRTAKRPLPTGRIEAANALTFSILLGTLALIFMLLVANILASMLLLLSMLIYGVGYTIILKPLTSQNIVWGGLSGALAPLIGAVAITGEIELAPLLLVAIVFLWTPPHFWALSLFKREEYRLAMFPMLVLTHGQKHTLYQILFYTILLIIAVLLPYFLTSFGIFYFVSALLLSGFFLYDVVRLVLNYSHQLARLVFVHSLYFLLFLFGAMLIDILVI